MKLSVWGVCLALLFSGCSFDDPRPETWTTRPASQSYQSLSADGECEVMHAWGWTEVVGVRSVLATFVNDGRVTVLPLFDQPEGRSGYFFRTLDGKIDRNGLVEDSQTVGVGGEQNVKVTRRAAFVFDRVGEPVKLVFEQMDEAQFDVPEFIRRLEQYKGVPGIGNSIEYLKSLGPDGRRHLVVEARF